MPNAPSCATRAPRALRRPPANPRTTAALPTLQPDAAGIDIGATQIHVAVPMDRDPEPLRVFGTFTDDLLALCAWLKSCGVRTVAMESTGVYWIPLFQILEAAGLEVCLVNARHVKNVPSRKSDVADCQWLQYLHAVGLLRGSFRPPEAICAIRSLLRHRDSLIGHAVAHVQQLHQALTQMNVQLHNVISDLTGKTGQAILDAILAGERDPTQLAKHRDPRIRASEETVARSLVGDWRPEHLFALRQALTSYRHYQQLLRECDAEIERLLGELPDQVDPENPSPPPARITRKQPAANAVRLPEADLRAELYRVLGVDLTQVPGLGTTSVVVLFTELGHDLSAFPTAKHFASWLGLCPDNRVSGGKVLSVKTRAVRHRVANALRLAAQNLVRSDTALGAFHRRMRAKLGAPQAVTATAHKLARIVYHMLTTRQPYDESIFARDNARYQAARLRRLHREAAALGFTLAPMEGVS